MMRAGVGTLSVREKVLVTMAVAALVLILGRHLLFNPLYDVYDSKQKALDALERKKAELSVPLVDFDTLDRRLDEKREDFDRLRRTLAQLREGLASGGRMASVFALLEEMAEGRRVDLLDVAVNSEYVFARADAAQPGEGGAEFEKTVITLSIESDYRMMAAFMRRLADLPLALSVLAVRATADPLAGGSTLVTAITFEVYSAL